MHERAARGAPRRAAETRQGLLDLPRDDRARRGARPGSTASRPPGWTASSRSGSAFRTCPGSREAVVKVKEHKTADCVVIGVRWKKAPEKLATLLLGLYREDGEVDYVGSAGDRRAQPRRDRRARAAAARRELRAPLLGAEPLGHERPRGDAAPPRARRRGALRQGAGEPLPPRHEADPLPAGQGSGAVHVARGEAARAQGTTPRSRRLLSSSG